MRESFSKGFPQASITRRSIDKWADKNQLNAFEMEDTDITPRSLNNKTGYNLANLMSVSFYY